MSSSAPPGGRRRKFRVSSPLSTYWRSHRGSEHARWTNKITHSAGACRNSPRRRRGRKFRYTQAFQGYIRLGIWLLSGTGSERTDTNDTGGLGTQGFLDLVTSLCIAISFENLRVLRQYGYQTQARIWKDPSKRQSLLFFILPFSWPKYIARGMGSFPLGNLRQNARFT